MTIKELQRKLDDMELLLGADAEVNTFSNDYVCALHDIEEVEERNGRVAIIITK